MPEERFFNLLLEVLGNEGELIQRHQLIRAMNFMDQIDEYPRLSVLFIELLNILESTNDFPVHHGPKYDSLLIDHPKLGSRVIEFDEAHHFTPHRMKTIQLFGEYLKFSKEYEALFNLEVVREKAISNNWLNHVVDTNTFRNLETTSTLVREHVETNHVNNHFLSETPGFRYPGGRLAQRAVYDLMKDLYHLIYPSFQPIIRFPIFEFENEYGTQFEHCTDEQIKSLILNRLNLL